MWLQNLLFLGTVVCSISAPTSSPSFVTRPWQHVDAIKEALSLLKKNSEVTAVMNEAVEVVSEMFDPEGSFKRPQNTSEEPCYGEFTKVFISTLKQLTKHNAHDHHIRKVYKDMKELTRICPKLEPTESPKNCTTEKSNFSQFKEALQSVVISIEGWKSCKRVKSSL
ncbi:granulocyte-macrophage colony-stimulating factor isoform X1 [Suricata suricatta]|uniref:granulocyte-macrophage colony-stimulating factor isoform X1 n=1 Tax=Suricata suricatta TaxID=37032 RepID=UPI00115575D2|nr:granulocyte-macrophage colony-stimulating factor isoform X1 [Suricata suricatta]